MKTGPILTPHQIMKLSRVLLPLLLLGKLKLMEEKIIQPMMYLHILRIRISIHLHVQQTVSHSSSMTGTHALEKYHVIILLLIKKGGNMLHSKLDSTQNDLNLTRNKLTGTEKELRRCKYAMEEKEFILHEQRKAGLNLTRNKLTGTEKELRRCKYAMEEKEFILHEQRKAEDALTQKACSLHAQLQKALNDNASLRVKLLKRVKKDM